jgi:hypothetical protein
VSRPKPTITVNIAESPQDASGTPITKIMPRYNYSIGKHEATIRIPLKSHKAAESMATAQRDQPFTQDDQRQHCDHGDAADEAELLANCGQNEVGLFSGMEPRRSCVCGR